MLYNFSCDDSNRTRLLIKNRMDEFEVPIEFTDDAGNEVTGIATILLDHDGNYTWRREQAVAMIGYYTDGPDRGHLFSAALMRDEIDLFPAAH